MKAIKAKLSETKPDRVEAFEKGAQAYAKKIVANFKDFEFYTGESMNPDGMIALLNYRVGQNCAPTLTEKADLSFSFFLFFVHQEDGITRMHRFSCPVLM